MNFLAHALHCLDRPYEIAGVATPDWLQVLRPRIRCRVRHASPHQQADEGHLAEFACGVVRHHRDDDWFHQSPAFNELSLAFSQQIRLACPGSESMRSGFVGHILVELLLDAELFARDPDCIDRYYHALDQVDASEVGRAVALMVGRPAGDLPRIVDRFREIRFLYDYADDDRLCWRINQVLSRVGLSELPPQFCTILPESRCAVRARHAELVRPL